MSVARSGLQPSLDPLSSRKRSFREFLLVSPKKFPMNRGSGLMFGEMMFSGRLNGSLRREGLPVETGKPAEEEFGALVLRWNGGGD